MPKSTNQSSKLILCDTGITARPEILQAHIRKYGSTSYVRIGQVQNDILYLKGNCTDVFDSWFCAFSES